MKMDATRLSLWRELCEEFKQAADTLFAEYQILRAEMLEGIEGIIPERGEESYYEFSHVEDGELKYKYSGFSEFSPWMLTLPLSWMTDLNWAQMATVRLQKERDYRMATAKYAERQHRKHLEGQKKRAARAVLTVLGNGTMDEAIAVVDAVGPLVQEPSRETKLEAEIRTEVKIAWSDALTAVDKLSCTRDAERFSETDIVMLESIIKRIKRRMKEKR